MFYDTSFQASTCYFPSLQNPSNTSGGVWTPSNSLRRGSQQKIRRASLYDLILPATGQPSAKGTPWWNHLGNSDPKKWGSENGEFFHPKMGILNMHFG